MTSKELKTLGEKIAAGKATPEEKLRLLKELNALVVGMRADLAQAKSKK